jgi:hypothetical protein
VSKTSRSTNIARSIGVRSHFELDFGPYTGRVVYEGTAAGLAAARSALTGEHLAPYVGA